MTVLTSSRDTLFGVKRKGKATPSNFCDLRPRSAQCFRSTDLGVLLDPENKHLANPTPVLPGLHCPALLPSSSGFPLPVHSTALFPGISKLSFSLVFQEGQIRAAEKQSPGSLKERTQGLVSRGSENVTTAGGAEP